MYFYFPFCSFSLVSSFDAALILSLKHAACYDVITFACQFELEVGTVADGAWRALRDADSSLCKIREFVVPEEPVNRQRL